MTGVCTGIGGRGCDCEFHKRARVKARNSAAKGRAQRLAAVNMSASTCQARLGKYGRCGGVLETITDGDGRASLFCALCERKRRGICRDCGLPVDGQPGKAIRCAHHRQVERDAAWRRHRDRDPEAHRAAARRHYQNDDERRRRRNDYKRAYRKANPDKVRAQKKRYVDRHRADPNSRYNRYHAKYREKYREQKRELERDRLNVAPKPRKTSPKCTKCGKSTRWKPIPFGNSGRAWTVCTACLRPCERVIRLRNRRRVLRRAKEWLESIPKKVRRPPKMAIRGPGWERLCITPGCETVLTHRRKKCTKCRARDAELAAQRLANHRGRGRRTDLKNVA